MSFARHKPDYTILAATGLIIILGLLTMASASPILSSSRFGEAYYFVNRQLLGLGVGLVALLLGWKINFEFWKKAAPLILFASIVLMVLVFVPGIGLELKGAKRWIEVPHFTVQPGEIMKLGFIIYLAAWMEAKRKHMSNLKTGFLPFLFLVGIVAGLFIFQPDIGTLGVLALTSLFLFFIGGGRLSQV